MSVKYVPAHATWVGASAKANTVECAACLQTFPAEQEWQSGGLPTVLTAEKRGREDTKPGRDIERRREIIPFQFDLGLYLFSSWRLFPWKFSSILLKTIKLSWVFQHGRGLMSFAASAEMLWGDISNQDPRGFIFIWHGSWNRVFSVSKPILLHGFSTKRKLW